MTTKVVQAFEAIINKQYPDLSDEDKANLLDGWIDIVLEEQIYVSIKKPTRKVERQDGEKKKRGATAYQLFQKSKAGSGLTQKEVGDEWKEIKQSNPDFVDFLKEQAIRKNDGLDFKLEMPKPDTESDAESDADAESDKE